jgi:hypothetical protein
LSYGSHARRTSALQHDLDQMMKVLDLIGADS